MKSKKINPIRKLSDSPLRKHDTYLLYAIEEGGDMRILTDFSEEQFKKLEKTGHFSYKGPGDYMTSICPAYAELVRGIRGHDFVIDVLNGDREKPKNRILRILNKTL